MLSAPRKLPRKGLGPRDWRPGIAWQLGIAFIGVALLAAVANFAVQRTISITTTRLVDADSPGRSVPVPRRAAVPATTPAQVVVDGRAALPAMERLSDVVQAGAHVPIEVRMQRVGAASKELRVMLAKLHGSGARADDARRTAGQLIEIDAARRVAFEELSTVLGQLDERFRAQLANKAGRFFGRSQSLVQAERRFQDLRRHAEALRNDTYTMADVQQLAALEAQFGTNLEDDRRALTRELGAQWHTQTSADFELLRALRSRVLQLDTRRREIEPLFRAELALVGEQLLQPATVSRKRTSQDVRGVAARTAPAQRPLVAPPAWDLGSIYTREQELEDGIARTGLAWLSGSVLALLLLVSVLTVRSILRPVQRLIGATQRIALGETGVRVPHGGSREMDHLAASFNRMAAELEAAQAVASNYQQLLEARVAERTRQLQHQADHDSLTLLPNRRQLFEQMRRVLASVSERGGLAGLFFIDLDNFKTINDGRGHGFGDRVLVAVAERLGVAIGGRGVAARFGGDEFIVLVEADGDEDSPLRELGHSLVHAFQRPLQIDGRDLLVSVSVGAAFYPEHASGAEALLSAADAALFRAKALGRSQLAVFTPELLEAAAARFTTEQALRHAVERGELELAFQPEVDIATLEVCLCEALLRWRRADGELLGPDRFLLIAEESGLIVEINDWVLRSAIAAAGRWRRNGHPELRVAVNTSARQLADPAFASRVAGLLRQHEVPPGALEIELTETVLQTGSSTIAGLHRLHEIGVTVALDDFGTGYSSLASLEQLPFDRVKLDRSLIAAIDSSGRSAAIANAIIQLCFDLDVKVTAEGVERPEQLAALRDNCITLQGFLLCRPLPEAGLDEAVRQLPQVLQSLLLAGIPAGHAQTAGAEIVQLDAGSLRRRRRMASAQGPGST